MTGIFILFLCFVKGVVLEGTSNGKECGFLSSDTGSNPSNLPWHASIYSMKKQPYMHLCGGTLVSDKVVISVGHCFWDQVKRTVHPALDFAVALGNLRRPWASIDDDHAQKSDLASIKLPLRFQGDVTNFQEDISLLVLTVPATFDSFVRPVCLDFDSIFERSQLQDGKFGKTVYSGSDINQDLRTVDLQYLPIKQCVSEAPISFREFITADKICVKISNDSVLCKGDSGIGVSFPQKSKSSPGQVQYFLRGVMSVAQQKNPDEICNLQGIGLLTQVTKHQEFIKNNIN